MTEKEAIACSTLLQQHFPNIEHRIEKFGPHDTGYCILMISDYITHDPKMFGLSETDHRFVQRCFMAQLLMDTLNMFMPRGALSMQVQLLSLLGEQKEPPV